MRKLAAEVVAAYIENVRLKHRKSNPYIVGSVLAQPDELVKYEHAAHEGYAGLNSLERSFADAIDDSGTTWCRNPPRSGFGIDLITVGPTQNFYPDFLVWTKERVVCVDTKGTHLVHETAARKLLRIASPGVGPRLDIQFVSEGKFNVELERVDTEGFTCWSLGDDGKLRAHHFPELANVTKHLTDDAMHPA